MTAAGEAIVAIGDLQGCDASLAELLDTIEPADARLWFVGDLVNRGPASLGALRRVRALGARATTVLGNHDLHLLAAASGTRKPARQDTLDEVLNAPDRDELVDWLRYRPLAHAQRDDSGRQLLLVHAGAHPAWSVERTLELAAEVQTVLRGPHWRDFMQVMYGNEPDGWDDALGGDDRLRAIVNVLTRMRYVDAQGRLELAHSGEDPPSPDWMPWYEHPQRLTRDAMVVFGHWSTRGLVLRPGLAGLDTGCVWGGSLTALRLHDSRLFAVRCPRSQTPGG